MTPEQLEAESIRRLKKQKADAASMEMSPEDMYQMYSRMSEQMRMRKYPATLEDLWKCLTESEYLKSLGAKMLPEGMWSLPSSNSWSGTTGTNRQNGETAFISWNSNINRLLSAIGNITDVPYVKCVTVPEKNDLTGLIVSTTDGPLLVTSFSQLSGITIDVHGIITEEDIQNSREELIRFTKDTYTKRQRMLQAEKENMEIAELHTTFLNKVTIEILHQMEERGKYLISDVIKQLETNMKGSYSVDLPADGLKDKQTELLFRIGTIGERVHVHVDGILIVCVLELIKREMGAMRGRNSEKRTADVMNRLERRK